MQKKILPYAAFALIVIAMVWVRVYAGASMEEKAGQEALARGDLASAVHHFDRAIHWYTPWSRPVQDSIAGLKRTAQEYQRRGDQEGELYAYRILRSALYSVRHVRQPHRDVIADCDLKIAALMALRAGEAGSEPYEAENRRRLEELSRPVGPKTGFALLAEAGFFGWVACAFLFIWFGIRPGKGVNPKPAAIFSLLFALFYALWILGLAKA